METKLNFSPRGVRRGPSVHAAATLRARLGRLPQPIAALGRLCGVPLGAALPGGGISSCAYAIRLTTDEVRLVTEDY
ncbi:MAG: hypothetical protein GF330_08970 [Candidatus Eisenbacteria bacterium]|nr:hypothetical protein [Candidatus Eisenbacteria bacterium]